MEDTEENRKKLIESLFNSLENNLISKEVFKSRVGEIAEYEAKDIFQEKFKSVQNDLSDMREEYWIEIKNERRKRNFLIICFFVFVVLLILIMW